MKLSTKILLIIGAVLLGSIILVGAGTRFMVSRIVKIDTERELPPYSGETIKRNYDFDDFEVISIAGIWQVDIMQSEEYAVEVPKEMENSMTVSSQNGSLNLLIDGRINLGSGMHIKAVILTPSLDTLKVRGAAKVTMSGLSAEWLQIYTDGASQVEGFDNTVENLYLDCKGAVNIDFTSSITTNAEVHLAGATNVMLSMNGGTLTGRMEGVGSVVYSGTVSEESIQTEGFANVSRR